MTQALDMHERVAEVSARLTAAAHTREEAGRAKAFAVTFGIAFAILYTLFERMNWPLFTYHPAVGKLDFWMHEARNGEGPPMYWFGWLMLAGAASLVVSWLATLLPTRLLQRATMFCCLLAMVWTVTVMAVAYYAAQRGLAGEAVLSVWASAIPGLVIAAAASMLVPGRTVERLWAAWLLIMPLAGLIILGNSLTTYFTR
jgi:hypothetical protein